MSEELTVGVAVAASGRESAACRIRWSAGAAVVSPMQTPVDDDALLALLREVDDGGGRVGVACPFGWPDAFVDAVVAHRDSSPWPHEGDDDGEAFRLRVTDRVVRDDCRARNERYGLEDPRRVRVIVSSPTSERLAGAVLRWARVSARHGALDRSGAGTAVEVHPQAALHCWDLLRSGLHDPIPDLAAPVRGAVLDAIRSALPGLRMPDVVRASLCDDGPAFDAFTAALVARAAARPDGVDPPADAAQRRHAATEGWIALPRTPLADLLD